MTTLDMLLQALLRNTAHTIANYSNGWGWGSGMDGKVGSVDEKVLNEGVEKGFLSMDARFGSHNRTYRMTWEGERRAACLRYNLTTPE